MISECQELLGNEHSSSLRSLYEAAGQFEESGTLAQAQKEGADRSKPFVITYQWVNQSFHGVETLESW